MSKIRTASRRHAGLGWIAYDQQFRLRLAVDPTGTRFDKIDYELWLLYVGPSMQGAGAERVMIKNVLILITAGVLGILVRIGIIVLVVVVIILIICAGLLSAKRRLREIGDSCQAGPLLSRTRVWLGLNRVSDKDTLTQTFKSGKTHR
ncbi:hypothetical protein DPMN_007872 [Dreissena polymorpha]|uniref:Uncharacterized protein n=1 Tax=Dreissena polymorpha TaxID=45954 RepID=A0A9D4RWT3_DREPO|nr:hypothetical protein DPMN_007872 [Dreissena polymorpha]